MYRWPSAKVCAGGSSFILLPSLSENRGPSTSSTSSPLLTNAVREPAIEKGLIGWPAFGKAQVAFALERLERAQQDGLAAAFAAQDEEGVERPERLRADAAVRHQIGIVAGVAVERRKRALEERDGNRGTHVHAGVEQLAGD